MARKKMDKQDIIIELLGEMLKWIKVTNIPHVKTLLSEILPSDKEKIAYHYSDGRSSREVAKLAGVKFSTVAKWWKTWSKAGIAELIGAKRGKRAKRIFSLEEFGIEVPSLKVRTKTEKQEQVPEEQNVMR
jgi:transposase-like protein